MKSLADLRTNDLRDASLQHWCSRYASCSVLGNGAARRAAGRDKENEMDAISARQQLRDDNTRYAGTGGVSAGNANLGFRPAFRDRVTDRIYPSCFADGRAAPFHMVDGLPPEVVEGRDAAGHVTRIKASLESGFVRMGQFFTRAEASALVGAAH